MKIVGRVESLWRYPVKSMAGEELNEAFAGFAGIYGDRFYAFLNSGGRRGAPYLSASSNQSMLLYHPVYRYAGQMSRPPNLTDAEAIDPGITPKYPEADEMALDVTTPSGEKLGVDDPRLIEMLQQSLGSRHELRLFRSHRSMTDCRPISLISMSTIGQLGRDLGVDLDKRRFRENIYIYLESDAASGEDEFIGRMLRIGKKAVIAVLQRDPRCKMMTLDPDTGEANPEIMKHVARNYDGNAGVYAAVVVEGTIFPGDEVVLIDR